jgi:hypothetical protein
MCKLRQPGGGYGSPDPAGSRGIDPSLQPLPLRSNCWGRPLWTGGIPATRPRMQPKPQFRPRPSGFQHWCCAVRWPVLHLRVAYFGQHPALRTSDASARPRHQRAHGVLLEGQNRDYHQSGQRCSLRWMMRRRGKFASTHEAAATWRRLWRNSTGYPRFAYTGYTPFSSSRVSARRSCICCCLRTRHGRKRITNASPVLNHAASTFAARAYDQADKEREIAPYVWVHPDEER